MAEHGARHRVFVTCGGKVGGGQLEHNELLHVAVTPRWTASVCRKVAPYQATCAITSRSKATLKLILVTTGFLEHPTPAFNTHLCTPAEPRHRSPSRRSPYRPLLRSQPSCLWPGPSSHRTPSLDEGRERDQFKPSAA